MLAEGTIQNMKLPQTLPVDSKLINNLRVKMWKAAATASGSKNIWRSWICAKQVTPNWGKSLKHQEKALLKTWFSVTHVLV